MKTKTLITTMLLLQLLATPAMAEGSKLKSVAKKVGYVVKKTIVLPVYLIGGAAAGLATSSVLWWYVGGAEGDLHRALSGQ